MIENETDSRMRGKSRRGWIAGISVLIAVPLLALAIWLTNSSGQLVAQGGPTAASASPTEGASSGQPTATAAGSSKPKTSAKPTKAPTAAKATSSAKATSRPKATKAPTGSKTTAAPRAKPTGQMSTVPPGKPAPTRRAPLGKTGDLGNGVTVTVSKVESVKGQAHGPGEIAGPALRISITVDNKTKKAVPMELALVNLYYGSDRTPAGPLSGPGADPLSKPVAAGKASTGTYVFAVPKDQRGAIEVEFTYTTAAPKVVFRGAV